MNMDNKGTTTSYEGVLPSHMPFDIWEVYARLVLQFLDEATYRNLSHRDKPDLWDELHDLGVEVTQAISQEPRRRTLCMRSSAKRMTQSLRNG